MKFFILYSLILCLAGGSYGQTFYGTTDVQIFRAGRDSEFREKKESPLKEEDFLTFKGLNYFPVSKAWRVRATFTRTADEKFFEMPTSSGKTKTFVKYGVLTFRLAGKRWQLSVYQLEQAARDKFPEYADLLFVPFKDRTARSTTYGGGRYIDIKMPSGTSVWLDFNLAYNPNCAYGSDRYNCPIPPRENNIDAAITAGEKRFKYTGYEKIH